MAPRHARFRAFRALTALRDGGEIGAFAPPGYRPSPRFHDFWIRGGRP